MASSVRMHLPPSPHMLDEPVESDAPPALPDAQGVGADSSCAACPVGTLYREDGRVMYRPADGGPAQAVRLVWARPLSRRGGEGPVSVMMAGKKKEVAYFSSLDELSGESREIAEEELARSMVMPCIAEILEVKPRFGNYYWTVMTDKGKTTFLLSSPENNTIRPDPETIILKDVSGNVFEISPVSALSAASLKEMDRVL